MSLDKELKEIEESELGEFQKLTDKMQKIVNHVVMEADRTICDYYSDDMLLLNTALAEVANKLTEKVAMARAQEVLRRAFMSGKV